MLADNLFRRVAFDSLRAGIPVGHSAVGVEHVDCIIGDALDQDPETPLRIEQSLLRVALLGHVAGDFCEADQLAGAVMNGINDNACPKPRAILSHAPTLSFELSLAARCLEHRLRHFRLAILGGVEERKVLADDFVGSEPLDPFRARVPARDATGQVQHIDCIIDDRLDE